MQLRHFRYFVAVAEEGAFLKAARRLRVAQPALSKQIHDLEREIGVVLFERLPRGVRLTQAGQAFLVQARRTLETATRAVHSARRAEEQAGARLHLAHGRLSHYAAIVGDLLAAFRAALPQTDVQIHWLNESEQRAALREHRIDVAATFVGALPVAGFDSHALVNTAATGVLLPASHPLAAKDEVSLPELRELTLLHIPKRVSPEIYRIVKSSLLRRGLVPSRQLPRPADASLACLHIAAGNAWMLVNDEVGNAFVSGSNAIVHRRFTEPPIPFWLALIWRLDDPSPLVPKLVDVARGMNLDASGTGLASAPASA
jgi:DNA-binding transcriptional LysR family regulator